MNKYGIAPETEEFFTRQLALWPMASNNFSALEGVEVKEVPVGGLPEMKVQFNPARRVSSAAKVDAASLQARKCFLCAANRPAEQISEAWGRYEILINPFPIFPRHLTIPDTAHTDQRIAGRIEDMCRLALKLRGMTVFYNGPRCGASAPDHMHFQAGNTDFLPLTSKLDSCGEPVGKGEAARLWTLPGLPMGVAVIDGCDTAEIAGVFDALYAVLPLPAEGEEPMMNVLCYAPEGAPEGMVRLVVIPRKQHRPSFYGTEGDDCWLISPASVDMGGVFITPREEDFRRITPEILEKILGEVCYSASEVVNIIENL